MKSIKNYLLAVLALAAILTVVSCKNEDDSIVATYTFSDGTDTGKIIFYNDGSFRYDWTMTYEGNTGFITDEITYTGTYTGDLNKNEAVITIKFTKATVNGEEVGVDPSFNEKAIVRDNGKKLDMGGGFVFIRD